MAQILVMDTSSIIHFLHYYRFDKNHSRDVYNTLMQFINDRIISGEIHIIDKVYDELEDRPERAEIKRTIRPHKKSTLDLLPEVRSLIDKYKKPSIIRDYTEEQLEAEITKYENTFADLFLVAYCKKLRSQGHEPILINDETRLSDNKIIAKIPTICIAEEIEFRKIPDVLFEIYKDELEFKLN
jgi:predicted nucleic acid-binding protein